MTKLRCFFNGLGQSPHSGILLPPWPGEVRATFFPFWAPLKYWSISNAQLCFRHSYLTLTYLRLKWGSCGCMRGGQEVKLHIFKKIQPGTAGLRHSNLSHAFLVLCGPSCSLPLPTSPIFWNPERLLILCKGGIGDMAGVATSSDRWYTATRLWYFVSLVGVDPIQSL